MRLTFRLSLHFFNEVKENFTTDDVRLESNFTTNKTIKFTEKSFFYIILGHTQSQLGESGGIENFVQLIPAFYKSDKPVDITGIDRTNWNCDCIQGSIVNGIRQSIHTLLLSVHLRVIKYKKNQE